MGQGGRGRYRDRGLPRIRPDRWYSSLSNQHPAYGGLNSSAIKKIKKIKGFESYNPHKSSLKADKLIDRAYSAVGTTVSVTTRLTMFN